MNKLSVFFMCIVIAFISCEDNNKKISDTKPGQEKMTAVDTLKADTAKWIDNFEAFRNAVNQNDRQRVKTFIDFPITEQLSDIWKIVYADGAGTAYADSTGRFNKDVRDSVPFTEKDFDKYYDKLFTKIFTKCLLQIKSEELYKGWETSAPEFKEGKVIYGLSAETREGTRMILTFYSKKPYGSGLHDVSGAATTYEFTILINGKIKLRYISALG